MTNDKLNKLAAKKVMVWEALPFLGCYKTSSGSVAQSSFNPCTSIADAWMLVEKITETTEYVSIEWHRGESCPPFWSFVMRGDKVCFVEISATTAPLAITKACLKAMGVEL